MFSPGDETAKIHTHIRSSSNLRVHEPRPHVWHAVPLQLPVLPLGIIKAWLLSHAKVRPKRMMKKNSRFLNAGFIVAWSEFADETFDFWFALGRVGNRGHQLQRRIARRNVNVTIV